eukprot:scaffold66843_cov22-Tisochrysis_lutea.AAC.1
MACVYPTQGVKQGCTTNHVVRLNVYVRKNHLIINTAKSEVMHFNSNGIILPVFMIDSDTLAYKDSSNILA